MNIKRHKYNGTCWWCNAIANSREHKYKKTDIINIFGRDNHSNFAGHPTVFSKREYPIQGPNSYFLKFRKVLCHNCNTSRSVPFDGAYEKLINYVDDNYIRIIKTFKIPLAEVYKTDFEDDRMNLKRYFAKHVGCRLSDAGYEVPRDIIRFLNGKNGVNLYISAELRVDILAMEAKLSKEGLDGRALWIGNLEFMMNQRRNALTSFWSHYGYRGIRFRYYYGRKGKNCTENILDPIIKLGLEYNLDPREVMTP